MPKLKKTITLLMLSVFFASAGVAHACQLRCWLADRTADEGRQHRVGTAHDLADQSASPAPPVFKPVVKDAGPSGAAQSVCGANSACLLASAMAPAAQHQLHELSSVERASPSASARFSSFLPRPPRPRPKA
jgi:hypothetical protein